MTEPYKILTKPCMLVRAGHVLLVIAMFSFTGGHWALFQGIAWARMIVEYSQDSSIAFAIQKTIGGQAPCNLCRAIEKGQHDEKRSPVALESLKKFEGVFITCLSRSLGRCEGCFSFALLTDEKFSGRIVAPPRPIPRSLSSLSHC